MVNSSFKPSKRQSHHVAIFIETTNTYSRGLLQGVAKFIRERGTWSYFMVEERMGENPLPWLSSWNGQGIIARIESDAIARAVKHAGLPTVDVSPANRLPTVPCFSPDNAAMAKVAFEHFHERGFKHFGFCTETRFGWALEREEGFTKCAKEAGYLCNVHRMPKFDYDPSIQNDDLIKWVKALPKPVAIMACYDRLGREILDACREAGCSVPSQVAVVGVDNDEVVCNLTNPPLSSVVDNPRATGYEAAALLQRMMDGEDIEPGMRYFPPLGVAARQSTDVLAVDDPHIAKAAQFIRNHAFEGIRVTDVMQAVPLSRRVLEQRFRKHFGVTPREEILRIRLNRVQELLSKSELSNYQIAEQTGFENAEYLSVVFKRETGMTPSQYRSVASQSPHAVF